MLDVQLPWIVVQHQVNGATDTGIVPGEVVPQRVSRSDGTESETRTQQVTDHRIGVIEQNNARAGGVTGTGTIDAPIP